MACELGEAISKGPRRNHRPAFKTKVALAVIKGEMMLAQLAEHFEVQPNQATTRKAQLQNGTSEVLGPGWGGGAIQSTVDVNSTHAKIGELTVENVLFEGALSKAGLLSTRR